MPNRSTRSREAILSAWSNPITLEPQRAHAAARVQSFSWEQAAREFHVCYRSVSGYRLTEDELVQWPH